MTDKEDDNNSENESSSASQIQQHPVIRGRRKRLSYRDLKFDETIKASDYEPVNDYFAVTHPAAARKNSMLGSYNHLNN